MWDRCSGEPPPDRPPGRKSAAPILIFRHVYQLRIQASGVTQLAARYDLGGRVKRAELSELAGTICPATGLRGRGIGRPPTDAIIGFDVFLGQFEACGIGFQFAMKPGAPGAHMQIRLQR